MDKEVDYKGICAIIKACAQTNVHMFRFRDMVIQFGVHALVEDEGQFIPISDEKFQEIDEDTKKQLEMFHEQEQLEELKLVDPVQFEKYQRGELNENSV